MCHVHVSDFMHGVHVSDFMHGGCELMAVVLRKISSTLFPHFLLPH